MGLRIIKMKKLSLVSLSTLLLSTSFNAYSMGITEVSNPFDDDGQPAKFYVGAGLGFGKHNDTCKESFINSIDCDDAGFAWKAYGGARLSPMFGIEGGYRNLGDAKLTGTDGSGNSVSLEKEIAGFDVEAVGFFPVSNEIEVFGKAGLMHWEQDVVKSETVKTTTSKDSGTSLLLGAGAQYKMNENTSLRAEWERVFGVGGSTTSETDVDMLTAGITFSAF